VKVLVTGADGQLGHELVQALAPTAEVIACNRAQLDLCDSAALSRKVREIRPDVICNAAAYTAVDAAETDADAAQLVNATAVGWLAGAAHAARARFIHVSTDFVFDGQSSRPYVPNDEAHPQSVYGRTKLDGEAAAYIHAADTLVVRTSWVYAARGRNFVLTMLRLMNERNEVRVVADQVGSPTYAGGLAKALWTLALDGAAGTFHNSDSGVASWSDFAFAIQEEALALGLLQRAVPVIPIATAEWPAPAPRPRFSVLDTRLTWPHLGGPPLHWRVNLRIMLREVQQHG
jgi:dTDP-4-dehydrorhamnose reductase